MINSFIQKLSTCVTAKSNISTGIDFLLLTSVTFLRAVTMYSAFTPVCGYDNSNIILIGDVYCPNTKCWGKFACPKRLFNLWAEAIINARNARLCIKCAIFFLKIKQVPFSCQLAKRFTILESPKSFQDVDGDVYCPGEYCVNREKCEPRGDYVTNQRSIYGF